MRAHRQYFYRQMPGLWLAAWAIGMEYNRSGAPTDMRVPGVREVMAIGLARFVVGHHGWSAKHMRVVLGEMAVLYDCDAVFLDRETFILGSAAAHFPVTWELGRAGDAEDRRSRRHCK